MICAHREETLISQKSTTKSLAALHALGWLRRDFLGKKRKERRSRNAFFLCFSVCSVVEKSFERTAHRIIRKRSILLEYVLLVCSILPLVFAASEAIYSMSGLFGGSFGPIGKSIVGLYQRIITIVSLPIP
jgi:hypothetical protein